MLQEIVNIIEKFYVWIIQNQEWVFSGIGVAVITGIVSLIFKKKVASYKQTIRSGAGSTNFQAGRDIKNIEMTKKVE
ncbi:MULTISPECIES: hypothetical protein [unclassified Prosthecochloris]|uniref:hypothetical protein n=1 Tax=unclassified Prosthecochloris TaxID=2632826 RepID=UPI00223DB548|nr:MULTISPECIES: hypothetical protein [unclassified Prosthecochloris]UZJ37367.1 hypothetical protein OO005_11540 [Prosthecochloris sp. SCSIO W1103]UZJ39188.1 hypothetical protein OO185_04450 [Prosthecochloris sp. SCSIO W1102]